MELIIHEPLKWIVLPRNSNFTVRGTAEVPTDQIANGTLVLEIVVRSIFDPETEFIYSIEYDFLGEKWIEEEGMTHTRFQTSPPT